MGNRLEGRVAIITGSGRGIGRGVALQMAEEGAAVVVADFGGNVDGSGGDTGPADGVVQEIKAKGGRAIAHYGDVSKLENTQDLVATALREFGKVDIMCHVAGILRDRMLFNMTEEEWDAVFAVHLMGAYNMVKSVLPTMLERRYGRILIFSSGSGLGNTGQANYSAAKEAQVGFSRALARELGPYGITVNAIYPGGATRMTQSIPAAATQLRAAAGIQGAGRGAPVAGAPAAPPPILEVNTGKGPTQGDPENNAPTTTWLCTEAGGAISGQVIGVSGWQASRYNPRHVYRSIHRARHWTIEELAKAIPEQLMVDVPNPAPKLQPKE
ncbi:MAG: SDR family NAD(P)-dependent oxidoreductase [Dehalococcoidia bacterium]|nr:MAG: SDR family NAD(P)-dependent oxidoreductase [Dehalococcoidia bacterium]